MRDSDDGVGRLVERHRGEPQCAGNLRIYPADTPVPGSSTLNYSASQTRANSMVTSLGPAGDLGVFCGQASGTADFIMDVNGYFE